MDPLEKIVDKMERPLSFVLEDFYKRLSLIKNLETPMTSLLKRMKQEIGREGDPSEKKELDGISCNLLLLFEGFELLPPEEKKDRLLRANVLLSKLKAILREKSVIARPGAKTAGPNENSAEFLARPVRFVAGVGPRIAALLARKKISTIEDLIYFLPRRYEDRRKVSRIAETVPGVRQTVTGRIAQAGVRFYGKRRIFEAIVDDGSGIPLKVKWFKGREAFLRGAFKPDARTILTGEITGFPFEREMIHPDFEMLNDQDDQLLHFKRIVPIYSETEGLQQKTLRRIQWKTVRDHAHLARSPIPENICRQRDLMDIGEALHQVHFPGNDQMIDPYIGMRSEAHRRLIYDEFFFFQLGMALKKKGEVLEQGIPFRTHGERVRRFYGLLPFSLTHAQRRVISEIEKDMASPHCMTRLLQGDVGSGKTAVAMAAIVTACENGRQAAVMAPTEILAEQHHRNLKVWAQPLGMEIELLTGGTRTSRRDLLNRIGTGQVHLVVGTHALIQEAVAFHSLGLVVIDEQHRFGVAQRAALRKKGPAPDVLVMTATPIPRTLAMTVYGDLDVSVIDEMPPGKKPVRTKVFSESQRNRVYEIIHGEVKKGNQVFIVYPLVESSENLDLKDATRMADHLQQVIFPDCSVGLVHGRMKGVEKERVMNGFARKEIQILVSTTVIEVGIDVPAASLMVIEHAERFGLSQLHQLRGRVGRSDIQSFCVLLTPKIGSDDARRRLKIMEQTDDGFRIAEEDLAIRGPGEFMGTRQSGLPDFRVASIVRDGRLLSEARTDAFALVAEDPRLESPAHGLLRAELLRRWGGRLELAKTG
jgi:ATP-dependent DNA helicase RecG